MRTVVLGTPPAEIERMIAHRRATGADLYDEVWEGEYHMAPAARGAHGELDGRLSRLLGPLADSVGLVESGPFNLGAPDDFRVPDRGIRQPSNAAWFATAALVVEIVSADDETWEKLPFYAAHDVGEVVVVDPRDRSVVWLERDGDVYRRVERSRLLGVDVAAISARVVWPPTDD
jgi:Uma2 family endonuclease